MSRVRVEFMWIGLDCLYGGICVTVGVCGMWVHEAVGYCYDIREAAAGAK